MPVLLLCVPLALGAIAGLLVLATYLEQRRITTFVRMTVRAKMSPEAAEALVAAELAPVLAARGFTPAR